MLSVYVVQFAPENPRSQAQRPWTSKDALCIQSRQSEARGPEHPLVPHNGSHSTLPSPVYMEQSDPL